MPRTIEERFWSKVDKDGPVPAHRPELGPCWMWTGRTDRKGYGRFDIGEESKQAHRMSMLFAHGSVPGSALVLHLCNNLPCVNQTHLYFGSASDNLVDAYAAGRVHQSGTHNGRAKLTEQDVQAIRAALVAGSTYHAVAVEFGISQGTVSLIKKRVTWQNV